MATAKEDLLRDLNAKLAKSRGCVPWAVYTPAAVPGWVQRSARDVRVSEIVPVSPFAQAALSVRNKEPTEYYWARVDPLYKMNALLGYSEDERAGLRWVLPGAKTPGDGIVLLPPSGRRFNCCFARFPRGGAWYMVQ